MIHFSTLSEFDGTFCEETCSDRPCRECASDEVTMECWESSCGSYEDYKYCCSACGCTWWVEGIDS